MEKVQENGSAGRQKKEEKKTERVAGGGRETRQEIVKWNQMTALRFQTEGETSDIPGLPSGDVTNNVACAAQYGSQAEAQEKSTRHVDSEQNLPNKL